LRKPQTSGGVRTWNWKRVFATSSGLVNVSAIDVAMAVSTKLDATSRFEVVILFLVFFLLARTRTCFFSFWWCLLETEHNSREKKLVILAWIVDNTNVLNFLPFDLRSSAFTISSGVPTLGFVVSPYRIHVHGRKTCDRSRDRNHTHINNDLSHHHIKDIYKLTSTISTIYVHSTTDRDTYSFVFGGKITLQKTINRSGNSQTNESKNGRHPQADTSFHGAACLLADSHRKHNTSRRRKTARNFSIE
jgi:hypothetical protein